MIIAIIETNSNQFCNVLKFINILRTAFMLEDPKSIKKTVVLLIFFTLSGSTSVKALHKTLVKLMVVLKFDFRQKFDPFQEEVSDLTIIAEYFCHHNLEKIKLFKN